MKIKRKGFRDEEIPEDLGVKVGTDEEIIWNEAIKDTKEVIKNLKKGLLINEAILEMAEKKAESEKLKVLSGV